MSDTALLSQTQTLPTAPDAPAMLACFWVIDATSGRPVCGWSLESWRPRPPLGEVTDQPESAAR